MKRLILIVSALLVLCSSFSVCAAEDIYVGGLDNDLWLSKYGNVYTSCSAESFMGELGFDWGDTVTVRFLEQELVLPVVPTYNHVESGTAAVIVKKAEDGSPAGNVALAVNMGNFAESYGLAHKQTDEDGAWYWTAAEGVSYPVNVSFQLEEKGGYMAGYLLGELTRTDERGDYSHLSDEEYANFRAVSGGELKEGVLYRSSNPVNPELGRNTYADAALERAGVTVIMNLADEEDTARGYEGFGDSYYSRQQVVYLGVGVDFSSAEFKSAFADGLRFFAENKGVYAVHCKEGKDRAGFASAILLCLAGGSYEELIEDYMLTYANYYGVERDTEMYTAIAESNIVKSLKIAFEVESLEEAALREEAVEYVRSIGLNDDEIAALTENLCGEQAQQPPVPSTGDSGTGLYVLLAVSLAVLCGVSKRRA